MAVEVKNFKILYWIVDISVQWMILSAFYLTVNGR